MRTLIFTVVVAGLFARVLQAAEAPTREPTSKPRSAGEATPVGVARFVKDHCLKCHGPKKQEGELRLDELVADLRSGRDAEKWNEVRTRILAGEMPPKEKSQPTATQVKRMVDWLTTELSHNKQITLWQPEQLTGNHVDHDALFNSRVGDPAASAARIWRISPFIYAELFKNLVGDQTDRRNRNGSLEQPFPDSTNVFKDVSRSPPLDEPTTVLLMSNANAIARAQTTGKASPPEF